MTFDAVFEQTKYAVAYGDWHIAADGRVLGQVACGWAMYAGMLEAHANDQYDFWCTQDAVFEGLYYRSQRQLGRMARAALRYRRQKDAALLRERAILNRGVDAPFTGDPTEPIFIGTIDDFEND